MNSVTIYLKYLDYKHVKLVSHYFRNRGSKIKHPPSCFEVLHVFAVSKI